MYAQKFLGYKFNIFLIFLIFYFYYFFKIVFDKTELDVFFFCESGKFVEEKLVVKIFAKTRKKGGGHG